jgi:RNA polymerase sigma-70 factor (ECF subfamily)
MHPDSGHPQGPQGGHAAVFDPETTIDLLQRVKLGDREARDRLIERCLPSLRRWAHGRLPPTVRDLSETADLVQDTVLAALGRLDAFEARREGALQAYLRQALGNRIRDLLRQRSRRPLAGDLPENLVDRGASPLEQAIGRDNLDRYEAALEKLRPADREAIIARLELLYSYDELAVALDKPSANAARVAVTRAVHRLVDIMRLEATGRSA